MTPKHTEHLTGKVELWEHERNQILSMQDLIDAGIEIRGIEGRDAARIFVQADTAIQEQVWRRLAERGIAPPPSRILVRDVVLTQHQAANTTCPYCDKPQGWDACPVHRDGTPAPTTGTEERRPDPRTTEQRNQ